MFCHIFDSLPTTEKMHLVMIELFFSEGFYDYICQAIWSNFAGVHYGF